MIQLLSRQLKTTNREYFYKDIFKHCLFFKDIAQNLQLII